MCVSKRNILDVSVCLCVISPCVYECAFGVGGGWGGIGFAFIHVYVYAYARKLTPLRRLVQSKNAASQFAIVVLH